MAASHRHDSRGQALTIAIPDRVAADLETLIEEMPPLIIAALAERLRECRRTGATAHLQIHAHVHQGDAGEWKFDPDIKVRRKKACTSGGGSV